MLSAYLSRVTNPPLKVSRDGDVTMHSGSWSHSRIPDGKECIYACPAVGNEVAHVDLPPFHPVNQLPAPFPPVSLVDMSRNMAELCML